MVFTTNASGFLKIISVYILSCMVPDFKQWYNVAYVCNENLSIELQPVLQMEQMKLDVGML